MNKKDKFVLKEILDAALVAVAPDRAVRANLTLQGSVLTAGEIEYDLNSYSRIILLGAGKGAAPMAAEIEALLGDRLAAGLVVVKYGHTMELEKTTLLEAAHPVPDAAGKAAAEAILAAAEKAGSRDLVICVLTGGASALTPALADGLALEDVQATTRLLLESGASIHQINAVRKHLSSFGGGQLARAANPATVLTLIVSDVVGDNLDVIASGPTYPDSSSFKDCLEIMDRFGLRERLPESILNRLELGSEGYLRETPKVGDPIFGKVQNLIVASNSMALDAASAKAEELGFEPRVVTASMTGEARYEAVRLADEARHVMATCSLARPVCLLAGGETTVTLRGDGKGGRNQEMALACALDLGGEERVSALFAGTDGTDGPTDAAGGYALPSTLETARKSGADAHAMLDDNNSYPFLAAAECLLLTGPTLTNVMDLAVLLVHGQEK